jgi:putative Mn2+ efflux pump MntP
LGLAGAKKGKMKNIKTQLKKVAAVAAATTIGAASAFADSTFADPSTITTTATTVFTGVATLMVGIVGFWVVLKIVRKVAGK